jgi:hypothetical protein
MNRNVDSALGGAQKEKSKQQSNQGRQLLVMPWLVAQSV